MTLADSPRDARLMPALAPSVSCGEPTAGLTYQKFAEKLVKNREDLKAKTGCKEVRFTVYVKDE